MGILPRNVYDCPLPTIKEPKKEEKCKYYSFSYLKSNLAESVYEDIQTRNTVLVFPDKSERTIPLGQFMTMMRCLPGIETHYQIGFVDDIWYVIFKGTLAWSSKPITTQRPQLNRYNALTLKER